MKKQVFVFSLLVVMILVQPAAASSIAVKEQQFGDRMEVWAGLEGLVADKATDIQLNPAFLTQIKDKELLTDFYLHSVSEGDSEVKLISNLGYRLNEANVLGAKVAFNSRSDDYILKGADGLTIDKNLSVGGRAGIEHINEEARVVLAGGAVYQAKDNLTLDGRVGLKDEQLNLFIRGRHQLSEQENLVGLINFEQGLDYKRLAAGKNTRREDYLLAYGGELIDLDQVTIINLSWGVELKISEKLTGRVGSRHNVFWTVDKVDDSTQIEIPSINFVNIGASYQVNEETTVDLAFTPELKLGNDSELRLSFTLQQKF